MNFADLRIPRWVAVVLAAGFAFIPTPARADGAATPAVHAVRTNAPVRIDGRLTEEVWQQAPPAGNFRQFEPDEGAPATEETEVRLAFDDHALYVGVRLRDREPARIVRRLTRRDLPADADRFSIYLDPQHDHLTGVQFRVSAAGVQQDAIIYNDTFEDDSWDAVWDSAVSVDDDGWSLEMRIPFSQLRFHHTTPMIWGVNFRRVVHRKNETTWLVMTPRRDHGLASRMAHLEGLENLAHGTHLELLPYTSMRSEFIAPSHSADPFNDGSRLFGGIGADVKYRVTSSLTLDASVNPDFGQVEVDPAVVNLTAFETFFEEKRPFFVEGQRIFSTFGKSGAVETWGFFRTEPDLFYSRRIGRPPQGTAAGDFTDLPAATTILGAAKLTGRTSNGWTVGLMEAVTGREFARTETGALRARSEVEPLTNYFVGRARRELGTRAGIGVLATATHRDLRDGVTGGTSLRDLLVDQAYVVGIDGHYFFDRKQDWVITGGIAGSHLSGTPAAIARVQRNPVRYLQRPDASHTQYDTTKNHLGGWTGHVDVNRNAGNLVFNGSIWGISPTFDANDLGFMYQADRAGAHGVLTWRKTTPDRFTRSRYLWVSKWWTWNWGRDSQGDGVQVNGHLDFLNYWQMNAQAGVAKNTWDDRLTRGGPTTIRPGNKFINMSGSSDARRLVSWNGATTFTQREFGGWTKFAQTSVTLRPSPAMSVSLGPTVTRTHNAAQYVREVTDPLATETFGRRYVFADLDQTEVSMTTRVNLVMSPTLSLQVYAQPLISVGDFAHYKELAQPRTFDYLRYGSDIGSLSQDPSRPNVDFTADPDGPGPAAPFSFGAGDFNLKSLRLNTILRWQWRPGSTLFVVWTEQRRDLANPGDFSIGRDTSALFGAPADDVVMVKITYWLGR